MWKDIFEVYETEATAGALKSFDSDLLLTQDSHTITYCLDLRL